MTAVALFVGSVAFLAPAVLTGGGDRGILPVDAALAEPAGEPGAEARGQARVEAQEKLDAAARIAFSQIDDMVTGSLPRDAAAAEAANPMTARIRRVGDGAGFPAIAVDEPDNAMKTMETVETVGSIPPRDAKPETADEVTASVGGAAASMPPPKQTGAAKAVKPAPVKHVRVHQPVREAHAAPRFQDRGPLAKVFRIVVMGVGFLPSRF